MTDRVVVFRGGALPTTGVSPGDFAAEADARADGDAALAASIAALGDLAQKDTVDTPDIANSAVTNAKMADMSEVRIKGRASGAGSGPPQDLTAAQARTAMGLGSAATTDASAYATAAQGAKADTAVQPAALAGKADQAEIDAVLGKFTLGLSDTSPASTALTAGRSYALLTPSPINGFVRRVRIQNRVSRPVRVFVANLVSGNLRLVRYVNVTTTGAGAEVIALREDLPVAAGQYLGVFFEVGTPFYVVSSAVGHLVCTGGFVTEAGLPASANGSVTLGLGFDVEAVDRREWSRITDKSKEAQQDWEGATWVALGTSITQNQFYGEQASKRLGVGFVNCGTGGSTWAAGTGTGDGRIKKRALTVDPRAELVTIEGPINDFRLNEPIGSVRETGAVETMLGALYGMVEDLQEANPFRSIAVVLSPPNMDSGYAGKWNAANGNGAYWDGVIDAVRKQAEWLGLEVITPRNMNGITAKWHAADLLHPDGATGAIMMANEVAFRVSGMPKSRVTQCATPVVAFDTGTGLATITCATAGAAIRYTTDGSNPTTASTLYSGAFTPADGDIQIRAIATKSGLGRSPQRRARIAKATASGLGVGTWNLRPAVVGDITSTRGVVRSLEGGRNWAVDVEPAPTANTAVWLSSGLANAVEFEVASAGDEFIILVGQGASGWMGLGYPRIGSISTALRYDLSTGAVLGSSPITPLPMGSAVEPSRRFRIARDGNTLRMFQNIYGTWSAITTGLDLSTISGATGYFETKQIGILLPVEASQGTVKNVLVGALS